MAALGGIGSPAGSCVWHVVGLQRSVREWAIRQGWGGRPVRQEQAQGILVAALGVLAAHLGYGAAEAEGRTMRQRSVEPVRGTLTHLQGGSRHSSCSRPNLRGGFRLTDTPSGSTVEASNGGYLGDVGLSAKGVTPARSRHGA